MEFEWNLDKAKSNTRKHHVSFEEAATVFNDSLSVTFPDLDRSIGESRYVTIGISILDRLLIVATQIEDKKYELSALVKLLVKKGDFMKKEVDAEMEDELRPEYDFSQLEGGVRGKYVERYRAGTNLIRLAPDVAQAFPTEDSVNEALRLLMQVAQRQSANNMVQPNTSLE